MPYPRRCLMRRSHTPERSMYCLNLFTVAKIMFLCVFCSIYSMNTERKALGGAKMVAKGEVSAR